MAKNKSSSDAVGESAGSDKTSSSTPPDGADFGRMMTELAGTLTRQAMQIAAKTGGVPMRMAKMWLLDPEQRRVLPKDQLRLMQETGKYLADVRQLAGMTREDLARALDLKDQSMVAAVEEGTATLSFELILRLASLVARHDPIPFVLRMAKGYNPEAWQILENWGIGRVPVHLAREREFINIYRGNDAARALSDEGFNKVLQFTASAFDLAMQFVGEQEAPGARKGRTRKTTGKKGKPDRS